MNYSNLLNNKGKLMISYKEIRKKKVDEKWAEMKQLNDNERLKGLSIFDKLPEDLQRYVVHPFLTPKEKELAPVYEYEEIDLR